MRTLNFILFLFLCTLSAATAGMRGSIDVYALSDSLEARRDSVLAAASREIARDSSRIEEYQKILEIYKSRRQYYEELDLTRRMVAANPASSTAYFCNADAFLDNGLVDAAIVNLESALRIDPHHVKARVTLAEAFAMIDSLPPALRQLDTALQYNNRFAQAHLQRARLLERMGRPVDAIENFRSASELLPRSFDTWFTYGKALFTNSMYEEAIDVLDYALTLDSTAADAYFMYAEAYERLGQLTEAKELYRQFMYRFPKHPEALEAERRARALGERP